MQKAPALNTVYNDLDMRIVNVFRVLRNPSSAEELRRRVELTPYSRAELTAAFDDPVDEIDDAHKTIVLAFMGFGSDSSTRSCRSGFRSGFRRANESLASHDWANWPAEISFFTKRLRGALIENCNAMELIPRYDGHETLYYVDPPYVHSTRTSVVRNGRHGYRHEMSDDDHRQLAELLHSLNGMVILSGYQCELYERLYPTWRRIDFSHRADKAIRRIESIWLNGRCLSRQSDLFSGHA